MKLRNTAVAFILFALALFVGCGAQNNQSGNNGGGNNGGGGGGTQQATMHAAGVSVVPGFNLVGVGARQQASNSGFNFNLIPSAEAQSGGSGDYVGSYNGICANVHNNSTVDEGIYLFGMGRLDDPKCQTSWSSPGTPDGFMPPGAVVTGPGPLSNLTVNALTGTFNAPDSGKVEIYVLRNGSAIDTGITATPTLQPNGITLYGQDVTHTFQVQAGDQIVGEVVLHAGDFLNNYRVFLSQQ